MKGKYMNLYDETQKVLHGEFDIELHKKTFIYYLEVIIDEDGKVHYAVPSHTEWLTQYGMKKYNVDREKMYRMIEEYENSHGGYGCEALCHMLNCVAVWFEMYMGEPSQIQENTLLELRNNGVYCGPVNITERNCGYGK